MSTPTASDLRGWLVSRLSAVCTLTPSHIDVRERFSHYGLDSLGAIRLIAELSRHLGRALSPTLIWEHPTVETLASYLTGDAGSAVPTGALSQGYDAQEPIAIIGLACRFPGAPDPAAFWRLLRDGVDAVSEVPADRGWDEILLASGLDPAERATVSRGAFLDRLDLFDPLFFRISPREATAMDPQQRLMLELCWEALEDAGICPGSLRGSPTGVFAGAIWSDYGALVYRGAPDGFGPYACTGVHHSIIANRISYVFGLEGPSLTLDSACSSGLVVVHLACDSLRRGESRVALAGAVNLNVLPESALAVSRFGALSPDGRCFSFDARANGYVRGEGGGVVVLKTLSRAVADGDPIHAVIRGSAVNNDGASNGLTAPSRAAQEAVLGQAYRRAGVRPDEVQYVEAHGTGTPLGDPIEARALGAVLGAGRPAEAPLLIGSAKTNVGHLEAAAGIVGLIKVALAIENRLLPASLHFASPNPHAPLAELGLAVPTSARAWPAPERALTAGISAFGLGGTNGHVVLQEWPEPMAGVVSLASTKVGAADAAISSSAGGPGAGEPELARGIVFVFPGQGAQWPGMARALLHSEPVFRATIEACDRHIRRYLGWSLLTALAEPPERARLDQIEVSLPAIISIDIAVSAWWRSLGVEPTAVVGHSTGEIAAAHVAGALDLDDAMRIICTYGRLVGRFAGQSGMAFVGLPWDAAEAALAGFDGRVFRAIEDSAEGTVVAGEPGALAELLAVLEARGVFCRAVSMNVGPHSPLVAPVRGELFEALRGIKPRRGSVPLISEVTGAEIDGRALDAAHWVRNFGDPALFSSAVDELIRRGHRVFLDVGPHPITEHSIEANLRRAGAGPEGARGGVVLASMRRNEDGRCVLRETIAALHGRGAPIRWDEIDPRWSIGPSRSEPSEPMGNDGLLASADAWILPLSARSAEALVALASAYAEVVRPDASRPRLRDLAYTASVRREHHPHRLAIVGRSRAELAAKLAAFARGDAVHMAAHGQTSSSGPPKLVFVFPGQGSQWVGMGRTLLAEEPAFRAALEACDEVIAQEAGFSVLEELAAGEERSRLSEISVVQPVLFALEVALAALWRSWGVVPDAVVGHSMGEVAAAHVAGILSLADAVMVICRRSRLLMRVSGRGAMGLVELTLAEAETALAGYGDRLSVAVNNGPRSTVISGDPAALDEVLAALEARGVFCRRVKVDVASHSPQMDPLLEELRAMLREVRPSAGQIAMRSTVTGAAVVGAELDAAYWAANLRAPVLFSAAIQQLSAGGPTIFLELSPHPILLPAVEDHLGERTHERAAIASMRRNTDERRAMLEALGEVWARGRDVDLRALHPSGGRVVTLPAYPWQRERFWLDAPAPRRARGAPGEHPLLGVSFTSSLHPEEHLWEQPAIMGAAPWLSDHRLRGAVIFPGGGYIEMMLAAGAALYGNSAFELVDVRFERMLALPCGALQLAVTRDTARATVAIASRAEGEGAGRWTRHAVAGLRVASPLGATGEAPGPANRPTPAEIRARCPGGLDAAAHYARIERLGVVYGPGLRSVERVWVGDGEVIGRVCLPPELTSARAAYQAHPALLDGCLQVVMALVLSRSSGPTLVPVGLSRARLLARPPAQIWVHAQGDARGVDLAVLDEDGGVVLEIGALRFAPIDGASDPLDDCVHGVAWRHRELPTAATPSTRPAEQAPWLVLRDVRGLGARLAQALRERSEACIEIDAAQPAELPRLLTGACRGVVHCGSLDAASWEETTPATLEADLRRGCLAAAVLVQAILRRAFRDPPRLFLVTRGTQAVEAGPVSVAQAPLWGMARVIALEHPELACTRIDLPGAPLPDEVELLVRELLAGDGEEQIALRATGRFVARLVRSSLDAPAAPAGSHAVPATIAADGTYLITGGLGGLGLTLARWMVEQGARHLVLVGRSAPGEAALGAIRAMQEAGADVRAVRGDVSRPADVERIVGEIQGRRAPLRGVVHAAVVVADRTLLKLEEEHLAATMGPKILGAWNLHTATRGLPLDFFVMYSSLASLLGGLGLAAYAAGNAFLDALAHARVAESLPATSIQWGAFAEVGLAAADDALRLRLGSSGIESFTPGEGAALFARVLERPRPEVGLFRFSLSHWLESIPQVAGMRYLSELPRGEPAAVSAPAAHAGLARRIAGAAPTERAALVASQMSRTEAERKLAEIWRSVLGLKQVGIHDKFFELGGDSILAILVISRARALGLSLRTGQLFEHQTIAKLAAAALGDGGAAAAPAAVCGPVLLTPIQRWFFAQDIPPNHSNQASFIEAPGGLDPDLLRRALQHLVAHHDALRMRFTRQGLAWSQECLASLDEIALDAVDLSSLAPDEQRASMARTAARLQTCLDISAGPVMRVASFRLGGPAPDRLLWIIHHLVVDAMSWPVLLSDLGTAYRQLAAGQAVTLQAKTSSFQHWAERLNAYARRAAFQEERAVLAFAPPVPLPVDRPGGRNRRELATEICVQLSREDTRSLIEDALRPYHLGVQDFLVTAVAQVVARWTGSPDVWIDLEGHGREALFEDVDLSRTVGCFTSLFPVRLRLPSDDPAEILVAVKEQLRAIPRRGIGYGLVRYLRDDGQTLRWPAPEISVNYLGQFRDEAGGTDEFRLTWEDAGPRSAAVGMRSHVLEVNGVMTDDRLGISFGYSRDLHDAATVERLASEVLAALGRLIRHCRSPEAGAWTPSDFPLAGLTRAELRGLVKRLGDTERSKIEAIYPLTPLQQVTLFHMLHSEVETMYTTQLALTLEGALDVAALRSAWASMICRHPTLRGGIFWEGLDAPVQVVLREVALPWTEHDARDAPDPEAWVTGLCEELAARPIALTAAPQLRLSLVRTGEQRHVLVWDSNHMILDGWSMTVMFREVRDAYNFTVWNAPACAGTVGSYESYLRFLGRQDRDASEAFWPRTLHGFDAPTPLVMERSLPAKQQGLRRQALLLDAAFTARIVAATAAERVTPATLIEGAWALLLSRTSGLSDVLFGTVVSGRDAPVPGIEDMVGLYMRTLPVRVRIDEASEVWAWLRALQGDNTARREHQYTPLVELRQIAGVPAGTVLFRSVMVFENFPMDVDFFGGGRVNSELAVTYRSDFSHTHYLLTVAIFPGQALEISFSYDVAYFDPQSIERMAGHMEQILRGMLGAPAPRISDLSLVTDRERAQVVVAWNQTALAHDRDSSIHALFEAQVARTPDAPAVFFADRVISYAELDRRANRLARYLHRRGVVAETRVGICVERSDDMIVSLFAVLKSGGAYVPLDPSSPPARLSRMVEDAGLTMIVTQRGLCGWCTDAAVGLVELDRSTGAIAAEDDRPLAAKVASDRLAYLIYTSGSTGQPTGVAIEHRNAVAMLHAALAQYSAADLQGVAACASICFDLSILEIFVPLIAGGAIIVAADAFALHHVPARDRVTLFSTVPSVMAALVRAGAIPKGVRAINLTGEKLGNELVRQVYQMSGIERIYNLYGSTAATTYSTYSLTQRERSHEPTLGRPIANTQVFLLDPRLQPVPVGIPGEIYIGGEGVSRGYWNRPALTAERFLVNPFGPGRLHKTGDLGRFRPDGEIEYLGRTDHQLNLRGFRVELHEIEAALERLADVAQAVVVVQGAPPHQQLVAYWIAAPARSVEAPETSEAEGLRAQLAAALPAFMVPEIYVRLAAFPLTTSGKIDRRELQPPAAADLSDGEDSALRTNTEQALAAIWRGILGVARVGAHDNFFALGGHSLLALTMVTRVERELGRSIPLVTLFESPTVRALARRLAAPASGAFGDHPLLVPFQTQGPRTPVFCVGGFGLHVSYLDALAPALGTDQPFYGLQLLATRADVLDTRLEMPEVERMEVLAGKFADLVQEVQPSGPYVLSGHSAGAHVALAIVHTLQARGHQTALAVLDVDAPVVERDDHRWDLDVSLLSYLRHVREFQEGIGASLELDIEAVVQMPQDDPATWQLVSDALQRQHLLPPGDGVDLLQRMIRIRQRTFRMVKNYVPGERYEGHTVFLGVSTDALRAAWVANWQALCARPVRAFAVPGDHMTMIRPAHAGAVAEHLHRLVDELDPSPVS